MSRMTELSIKIRSLEDQLITCMRCGMCQSVCPVFDQTGREADVARGKLALLSGLMASMFDDPEGVYERLNKCLLCGSCAANCPSGVRVQEIFLKARAILTGYMGLPPAKRLILRGMLANPAFFDPKAIVELAIEGGCNAVASTLGVLGAVGRRYAHRIPFLVKLNHNELLTHPNRFDQTPFAAVEQAESGATDPDGAARAVGAS